MTRLDRIAKDFREPIFASAFLDDLLTPTSFTAKYGEAPDAGTSALFAELASLFGEACECHL